MRALIVRSVGSGVTVQDFGRQGLLGSGFSRGGAMDRQALFEGAALLRQKPDLAAVEMAGFGGVFEASADMRIALTGAPMRAKIDGKSVAWSASHLLPKGAQLVIGPAILGCYGYLHVGGGFDTPVCLGSRSAHLAGGIGAALVAGNVLPVAEDPDSELFGFGIDPEQRFEGFTVRVLCGPQTRLFADTEQARFAAESFRRDTRGNRMGVRFLPEGAPFTSEAGLSVLSEVVVPGDIQITGDGTPFVLMTECQTTGGYPRIGTVLQADLPRVAQARPGDTLRFEFVDFDKGLSIEAAARKDWQRLSARTRRLVRRPEEIPDLLSCQLIGGVTAGDDLERQDP
ncbi:biotin-dependent carboxyltransferase family protein [Defluviimonas aestuarii]|uniref:5-oxoprolinase subunit C family protein n=1 Tax=Albidovulum aestuarii TaxID=1130726 RepID=UPI00249BA877|nr:biotin-dependent carboxyltransferase family protein [Defluviimonas aestuarii]MDI3335694.1 biotin-dependent carboxyltransferase family protein [Defluviimonas aestuarii]